MAESRVDLETESAEYRSFKSHYNDLFNCIQNPVPLSTRLYSVDLLSRDTKKRIYEMTLTEQRVSELLDATETTIQLDPQNFHKFVEKLAKDSSMQHLCDKLRSTCAQLKSLHTPQLVSLPPSTSEKQTRDSTLSFSSSITSSSHSSTTALTRKQYKQFLKRCYQQALPDDDKLLVTASKHYIELAVISMKGVTRKQADEFTKKSLHGLTEEILREKAPIALDHILKPREDGRPVRCVLVEGAPGIGKSTLAWEVCHKWEELESVKQYELVVLVRLREKKAQEACCLEELLPCDTTTNLKELLAAIGEGESMLIVCDGFDELPCKQRQEDSVYIDLLKARLLPEATIIVTSRPSVSADLWSLCQHNIHRHLEVIGFTKKDIKQFAESVFSGDILTGFLSYITSNPPIYGMMYIPLNAVIVALIYQDSYDTDTPFPATMTQLFDTLTRGLIRRHLVSVHQVASKYRMPPSLQRTADITKLPSVVAKQLLQLTKVAYETMLEKRYVFTNLGEDFEHLGTMKKTTSVNVWTGPGCSYSFLHLTLQEYLTALHIAIVNPSGFKLVEWLKESSVVVRFLAGIFQHDEYHSHPVYQELVQQLASKSLQLVHCAYECPTIMGSVKVDYSKRDYDAIVVTPVVGFDCYVTGYCISHFDDRWGLMIREHMDIGLLVTGLRSSPNLKRKIQHLTFFRSNFSQVISQLKEFCELLYLRFHDVNIDHDDEVIIQELIASGSALTKLQYVSIKERHTNTFIPLLFQPSSLQELKLNTSDIIKTELLPCENTNLKKLIISRNLLHSLATVIMNITSLTLLEISDRPLSSDLPVLTNIVRSHDSLEVLQIKDIKNRNASPDSAINLLQLVVAAGKSRLKKLRLNKSDYDKLPPHICEHYKDLFEQD